MAQGVLMFCFRDSQALVSLDMLVFSQSGRGGLTSKFNISSTLGFDGLEYLV